MGVLLHSVFFHHDFYSNNPCSFNISCFIIFESRDGPARGDDSFFRHVSGYISMKKLNCHHQNAQGRYGTSRCVYWLALLGVGANARARWAKAKA